VEIDNRLVIISSESKKYLSVITKGKEFITNDGKIEFDKIKSLPTEIESSTGKIFTIYVKLNHQPEKYLQFMFHLIKNLFFL